MLPTAQELFETALTMALRSAPDDLDRQTGIVAGACIASMAFLLDHEHADIARDIGGRYLAWLDTLYTPEQKEAMTDAGFVAAKDAYASVKAGTAFGD